MFNEEKILFPYENTYHIMTYKNTTFQNTCFLSTLVLQFSFLLRGLARLVLPFNGFTQVIPNKCFWYIDYDVALDRKIMKAERNK